MSEGVGGTLEATIDITRMIPVTPVIFLLLRGSGAMGKALEGRYEHDHLARAHRRGRCRFCSDESRRALDCAQGRTRDADHAIAIGTA